MNDESQLIEAFIRSSKSVLDTLCGYSNIDYNKLSSPAESGTDDLIGIMGVNGRIIGSALICIPESVAARIVSRMTGSEPTELSRIEVGQGIAELLNIICGNAKTILSESEFSFNLTVPRILSCRDYHIENYGGIESFALEFKNSEINYSLYVSYSTQNIQRTELSGMSANHRD